MPKGGYLNLLIHGFRMDFRINFISKFFGLFFCFFFFQNFNSQTKEEKLNIQREAQRLFRTDVKKSIKLYEYLLENSDGQELQKYEIGMVKLKLLNSENIEAIDLMFQLEQELLAIKNPDLHNQFHQLESEVFYYFGFKKVSDSIHKLSDSDSKKENKNNTNYLFNIPAELKVNPSSEKVSSRMIDAEPIERKLNQNIGLFTKAKYLAQLRQYYGSKNNQLQYMLYDKQLLDLQGLHLHQLKISRNYLVSKFSKLKQQRIEKVQNRIKKWSFGLSIIFIGMIGLVLYYPKNDKETIKKKSQVISDKAELRILEKLKDFENSEKFLDDSITITILAKHLDTNVKYLSTVLNNQKQKSFNLYINELRIQYITERLKNDKKFRSYKISYLATVCGFTSHSSFTSFFKSIVGITASAYINKLNQEDDL